jgi:High potential iron-sulfur protein
MSKLTKKEVDYSKGTAEKHCGICHHFRKYGHDHSGKCAIVEGEIDPEDWCKRFEKSLRSTISDAAKEYMKPKEHINAKLIKSKENDDGDHEYR